MSDDAAAPVPGSDDAVESQLAGLEASLIAELGGGELAGRVVRQLLAEARERYAGAAVRTYLPILIERETRRRLRNQPPEQLSGQ